MPRMVFAIETAFLSTRLQPWTAIDSVKPTRMREITQTLLPTDLHRYDRCSWDCSELREAPASRSWDLEREINTIFAILDEPSGPGWVELAANKGGSIVLNLIPGRALRRSADPGEFEEVDRGRTEKNAAFYIQRSYLLCVHTVRPVRLLSNAACATLIRHPCSRGDGPTKPFMIQGNPATYPICARTPFHEAECRPTKQSRSQFYCGNPLLCFHFCKAFREESRPQGSAHGTKRNCYCFAGRFCIEAAATISEIG